MNPKDGINAYLSNASAAAQVFGKKMIESGASVEDFVKQQKMSEVSLAAQSTRLSDVKNLFDEYNLGCKNTGLAQQDFVKAVGESNRVAGNYLSGLNGGQATMRGYVGSLIAAKAATIGLQAATMALNVGITMLVTAGISWLVKNVIQADERLKESAEKITSTYKNTQDTLKSNKTTIEEISSDYEKLSKGVDRFGNNISLSNSEYERYQEIAGKIANMFPELIQGYNDEGTAIIATKGKVDALTEAYERKIKASKQAYQQDADTVYQNSKNELTKGDKLFGADGVSKLQRLRGSRNILSLGTQGQDTEIVRTIMSEAGYSLNGNEGKDELEKIFRENTSLIKNYYQRQLNDIEPELSNIRTAVLNNLELTDSQYQKLSQGYKGIVQTIVGSLDDYYIFNDKFDNVADIYNDFHARMAELVGNKELSNQLDFVFNCQTKLNDGDTTIGNYQKEIDRLAKVMADANIDEDTQRLINISFGIDDRGLIQDKKNIENVVAQLIEAGVDEGVARGAVGNLKLPEFSQMLNNGGQFKDSITKWLQENQGATAAQFSDWFNSVLSESANSVSDSSSVILNAFDKAATGITEFKNAMDSSKGSIKSGTEAFEGYADAYTNAMKLINEGYDLDNGKLYAYMELLLGKDTLEKYGYNVDTLKGKLKELKGVYGDKNSLGDGFLDKLKKSVDKNGDLKLGKETIATFDKKSGEWSIDNNHFADVAKALDMTEDGLVSCIQAMSTWSNVALESLEEIKERAESAGAVYHEQFEGQFSGKDVVNVSTLESSMKANGYTDKQAYDAIQQLKKDNNVITIDVNADSDAKSLIDQFTQLGLATKDDSDRTVVNLKDTVDLLKETKTPLTDIVSMMTTLYDSGVNLGVNDTIIFGLDSLRSHVEDFYNFTGSQAERANEKLKQLGVTTRDFDFNISVENISDFDTEISEAQALLDQFKNDDGTVDLSLQGAYEAETILSTLITQKQVLTAPEIMQVDTSQLSETQGDIKNAIDRLQEFKLLSDDLELKTALGIDTSETQKKLREVATSLRDDIPEEVKTTLGINTDTFNEKINSISNSQINVTAGVGVNQDDIYAVCAVLNSIKPKDIDVIAKTDPALGALDKVGSYKIQDKTFEVKISNSPMDVLTSLNNYKLNTKNLKVNVNVGFGGSGKFNGTAQIGGTAHAFGTAKASGDWGTAKGGTSLVGELGEEVIVDPHTGRWYTVGENGAEFRDIPQGAIVFNHKQTESLLKYGHINSRGTSLVGGTALASGTAYVWGSDDDSESPSVPSNSKSTSGSSSKSSSKKSTKKSSKSSSKSSSTKSSTSDYTDWIEIAISRVERVIKNLGVTAKSTFQSLTTRLKASSNEIVNLNKEISIQQKGAQRYLKQANSVKLSDGLKKKVREGTIDITKYDEKTRNLISTYKTWYEKSLACSDAVLTLKESLATLYKERFDEAQKDFSNQLSLIQSKANMLNEKVSALEAKGYLKSVDVYSSLKSNKLQEIKKMEEEKTSLEKMLADGGKSGTIVKYSEAWYSMNQQIDSTTQSIAKAKTELIEYDNTMRKIDWEHFDYLQDRILQIPTEAKFLSELLDEEKLYEDNGDFTKYGTAKLGLNIQDYNVYINQAKQYTREIAEINKLLADDPFNTNLISRREELLKLQRESIKSANDEKMAVKSLVEDGIKEELSSVKDLIDAYSDELDNTKDLYDYQKKISEKTSNIASLNKQLAAYVNDSSEESKVKVQKLKVELDKAQTDLQEAQYERSISDQKKLLDNFYSDYEETLNKRLDDVDRLLTDMTDVVDANGSGINQTLKEISSAVGYGITEITQSIWNNSSGIGKSVDKAIGTTKSNVNNMVANSNAYVKKYATGGLVDYTGIAKVDGSKSKPELVLNPQDTQNLLAVVSKVKDIPITVAGQEFAGYKSMVQHAIASPDLYGRMSAIQNHTINQDVSNNITFSVNIDHVENFEDFMEKAKNSNQFEKMVQSMTVDRLTGGSVLAKHKYSWK